MVYRDAAEITNESFTSLGNYPASELYDIYLMRSNQELRHIEQLIAISVGSTAWYDEKFTPDKLMKSARGYREDVDDAGLLVISKLRGSNG